MNAVKNVGGAPPQRSFGAALRLLVQQAWPVLVGQWAGIAFGVLDTVMTGHASPVDLAAMALAVSIYVTVFVGLMGVIHALIPILAQHYGAGQRQSVGEEWGQGVWLALMLSVLGAVILLFPDPWLAFSGDLDEAVRARIRGYLLALVFALPAALVFRTMHALGTAVSRPKVIMYINLGGVGVKAWFNWLFIYGKFGLPAMGAVGAGISTALTFWLCMTAAALVMRYDSHFHPLALKLGRPRWRSLRDLLRLGLPMGGSYLIEVLAFTFMALMVAREGVLVTGAHQITANLAALCYMAPMAIGIATAAQTAQALGAGAAQSARTLGRAGMVLATGAALITIALLVPGRSLLASAYTSDAQLAATAFLLLAVLPFFHVADAAQTLTVYLLRAYRIAFVPMLVQTLALGGIGLIGGWWFAFGPAAGKLAPLLHIVAPGAPIGAASLWTMSALGLCLSLALLQPMYWYVSRHTPERRVVSPTKLRT